MWCNNFDLSKSGAIHLDLTKGVVQYLWNLSKGVVQYLWFKQGCGAILLELNKGVMQYFWLKQGCCAILFD